MTALLAGHRVLPVLVIDDLAAAEPLGAALVEGGLSVLEVTLRTPQAIPVIRALVEQATGVIGAGSVVRADQAQAAIDAGARFVVSPGLSAAVAGVCADRGVPYLPGVASATEVMAALDLGIEVLKFFPAASLGGHLAIRALAAPFPDVRFVPTGGVTAGDARDYLELPQVLAVGGSWMAPPALVRAARWDEIRELARQAVARGGS
jgi:2-dehydro-3-deoxyphosphogluconate aldolase / (4S)-4-hydroxy-2-oxoglutarate aldolase